MVVGDVGVDVELNVDAGRYKTGLCGFRGGGIGIGGSACLVCS